MAALAMNNPTDMQELTMTELDLVAGGIDWGVTGAGALGGALGGARLGVTFGPWGAAGGVALGGLIGV